jgi:protoporphyrinogen oxidase
VAGADAGRTAIIIGAGPAGLTCAYELLERTNIRPIVLERSERVGGLARTEVYRGNRIDIGGHRFFSKSERVMRWWLTLLPLERVADPRLALRYQGQSRELEADGGADPEQTDRVMLVRPRASRIYYRRQLFDYPLRLTAGTLRKLGVGRTVRIALSYLRARAAPLRPEENLEQFLINRFGRELYRTFFEDYTEKVWGVPCRAISAEWGAQRIKGLSIGAVLRDVLLRPLRRRDVAQRATPTSLIERFLYPKLGPGQMWETCAAEVVRRGGVIIHNAVVDHLAVDAARVARVSARDAHTQARTTYHGDLVFSTMPVQELAGALDGGLAPALRDVAAGLIYRDFITVGVLLRRLALRDGAAPERTLVRDNWIYVQDPEVRVGRVQIFNNWSPYLVADPATVWLGLEYFCTAGDDLWARSDADLLRLATDELARLGLAEPADVLDAVVIRVPKTYPAYFGAYARFEELRAGLDRLTNLYLIGRNGQHRYNNQDHSMLAAMVAVDNLVAGRTDKANIWAVNAEQEYHEDTGQ